MELWGKDYTALGEERIEALSADVALAITRGRHAKRYRYTDPNEDVTAIVERPDATLLTVADGHNGQTGSHVAVQTVLDRWSATPDFIDLFDAFNDAVVRAQGSGEHPESRTTLIVAIVVGHTLHWAAMGDSTFFLIDADGNAERLGPTRSWFVGWPGMKRDVLVEHLPYGTRELTPGSWIVLVTDGLEEFITGNVAPVILDAVRAAPDAATVCQRLFDAAGAAGSGDNVAAAIMRVR